MLEHMGIEGHGEKSSSISIVAFWISEEKKGKNFLSCHYDNADLNKANRKLEVRRKELHQGPHSCAKAKARTMEQRSWLNSGVYSPMGFVPFKILFCRYCPGKEWLTLWLIDCLLPTRAVKWVMGV